jgi:hypothetical protein
MRSGPSKLWSSEPLLAQQIKLVASNVTAVILKDTGHWLLEERPQETTDALVKFL